MSKTVPRPTPDNSANPASRPAFFVSPGILIAVAIVLALAVGVALLLAYRTQAPWVEIVGKDLMRTTAPSKVIASARDAVIEKHRNWVVGQDGKRSDPSYQGRGRSWKTGPSPEDVRLKVTRGKTQITDRNGHTLSIETISATDTPTLIFIQYDGPAGVESIMNELVRELTKNGVKAR